MKRIASGEMLGSSTPVKLQLLNIDAPEGVKGATKASSAEAAFKGASYALLLGGSAADFAAYGKALGAVAPTALVGVVGNTNALIASKASGKDSNISAVTRHAEMAAAAQLAEKAGQPTSAVKNVIAWGNGSVADVSHATVDGKWALDIVDNALPAVSLDAADGAADAAVSHMRDWALGSDGRWVSMGVPAVGDFGTGTGIFYSVPVVCTAGAYKRVGGVSITPESAAAMEKSRVALVSEAKAL